MDFESIMGCRDGELRRPQIPPPLLLNAYPNNLSGFPPIGRHGVIGDRRTGALVAADGSINWLCVPDFDGVPIFGALLDPDRGGVCQLAPVGGGLGSQSYSGHTAILITTWENTPGVEVADVMAWPSNDRLPESASQRIILRRLRSQGASPIHFCFRPRRDFFPVPDTDIRHAPRSSASGTIFSFEDGLMGLWTSFPVTVTSGEVTADLTIAEGEEHWAVLGWDALLDDWSITKASAAFNEAEAYWKEWSANMNVGAAGSRSVMIRRCALTVQLLSHAHHDSAIAALTTSLPERIGGDRNYDYRYAWIRDGSLALALLARVGKIGEARRYLDWLCGLGSSVAAPLQVCYRLDGGLQMEQEEVPGISGYENSLPVHCGNRAYRQEQLGAMGFFADCARIYLEHGGEWRNEFWDLLSRAANFTVRHWQEKDNGIWELPEKAHYVASRVMAWVLLDRAVKIGQMVGRTEEIAGWQRTVAEIHAEVMDKGWCEEQNTFRQRYDAEALDGATLLIPLMEFLPIDHPRIHGTLAALESSLLVDGLLHRFDPSQTLGGEQLPIGEFEGAFLPCVFWHAHVLAKMGRHREAETILERCDIIAGEVGLFAEEVDAKRDTFLGNTPLLFSHVEYARAVWELNHSR
jgi:GH15 family glucan-1,4-alpha-glucosidase